MEWIQLQYGQISIKNQLEKFQGFEFKLPVSIVYSLYAYTIKWLDLQGPQKRPLSFWRTKQPMRRLDQKLFFFPPLGP